MEAIRILKKPKNGTVTIPLPEQLKNQKRLEIIVLPVEEKNETKKKFDPREFYGAANLNMRVDEIDKECPKMRDEWERDF